MPSIHEIITAVYRLLKGDAGLTALSTVYKGAKRPTGASNPATTIEVARLEPANSHGIWTCDIAVRTYVDNLPNDVPDREKLKSIETKVNEILAETVLEIADAKAFPLIERRKMTVNVDFSHYHESYQESDYGLVFVQFN